MPSGRQGSFAQKGPARKARSRRGGRSAKVEEARERFVEDEGDFPLGITDHLGRDAQAIVGVFEGHLESAGALCTEGHDHELACCTERDGREGDAVAFGGDGDIGDGFDGGLRGERRAP